MQTDYFRKAFELNGEQFGSLRMLISCQLRSNTNIEECLRLSESGFEKRPESLFFLWYKGLSLHKLDRHKEALAILLKVDDNSQG